MAMSKSLILRAIIIYFITSFFRKPSAPVPSNTTGATPLSAARNMFLNGTELSLYVYISERPEYTNFKESDLFWFKEKLIYGDWISGPTSDGIYTYEKDLTITEHLKNNGSLYLHAYLTRHNEHPNPRAKNYGRNAVTYVKKPLNR